MFAFFIWWGGVVITAQTTHPHINSFICALDCTDPRTNDKHTQTKADNI